MIDHDAIDLNVRRVHLRNLLWKGSVGLGPTPHHYCAEAATPTEAVNNLLALVHEDVSKGARIAEWLDELRLDTVPSGIIATARAMRDYAPHFRYPL